MHKVEERAMDDQYDVDNDEKVVRVPERIETSESIKRFGKLNEAPPKPSRCKSESNGHEDYHYYSCHTFHSFNKIYVLRLAWAKIIHQIFLIIRISCMYKLWEITYKMITGMEYDTSNNGCSNSLVEVDVVIKGYKTAQFSRPEECNGVPANWQQYQSHVEL